MNGRGLKKGILKSKSEKAGLVFPVARFHRYLKNQYSTSGKYRISAGAAVYTASVLEYLVAEVTEQAGNVTKVDKRKRISPRHIMWAVFQDAEMNHLLKNVILPSTGRPVTIVKAPSTSTVSEVRKKNIIAPTNKIPTKKAKPRSAVKTRRSKVGTKVKNKVGHVGIDSPEILNERTLFLGQKLTVLQGDIVNVTADAVVHPTSSNYGFAGEVGRALALKGGIALEDEVNKLRAVKSSIKTCEAAISGAVNIPYKHIIHINSPSWTSDVNTAVSNLQRCVNNVLDLADKHHIMSIAMPSISSGGNGYPKQIAAETILRAINAYFAGVATSVIKQIFFVIYDKETLDVYKDELTRLA